METNIPFDADEQGISFRPRMFKRVRPGEGEIKSENPAKRLSPFGSNHEEAKKQVVRKKGKPAS